MADTDNGFLGVPAPEGVPMTDGDPSGASGFLSSPNARVLIIAGAVVGLIVVVAVVAGMLMLWNANGAAPEASSAVPAAPVSAAVPATSTPVSSETSDTSEITATVPVSNNDVFSFRNPFTPTIAPVAIDNGEDVTSETIDPNVLTLQNIISKDGEVKAILAFGGVTYTAGEGDELGTTPWKVLSIGDTSVSMLYGDVQVTLSLGEGLKQ